MNGKLTAKHMSKNK